MLRRALPLPLRMRPRVQRAPGIPCALRSTEGQRMSQLGRKVSRECEVMCQRVRSSYRGALEQQAPSSFRDAPLGAGPESITPTADVARSWGGSATHHTHRWLWIPGSRFARPGMTTRGDCGMRQLARASDAQLRIGESITTKLRLGHDAAPVMFNINIGGYGFRARCFASPRNDSGGIAGSSIRSAPE
jgi:hypothetical protein